MRDDGRFGETEPTGGGGEIEDVATTAAEESATDVLPTIEAEQPAQPRVDIPEWVSEIRRLYVEPKHPVVEEESNARHRRTSFVRRGRRVRGAAETPAAVVSPAAHAPAPAEEDHVPRGLAALAGLADEPSAAPSASHTVEPEVLEPVAHDPTVDEEQAASRLTAYLDVSSAARLHDAHPVVAPVEPVAGPVVEPVVQTSGGDDATNGTRVDVGPDERALDGPLVAEDREDTTEIVGAVGDSVDHPPVDPVTDIETVPEFAADAAVVADLAAAPELVPPVLAASELLPPVPAPSEQPGPVLHDPGLRFDGPDADEAMIAEAAAAMRRTEVADLEEAWRRPAVDREEPPADVVGDDAVDEAVVDVDESEPPQAVEAVQEEVVVAAVGPDVAGPVAPAVEREDVLVGDTALDEASTEAQADVVAAEDERPMVVVDVANESADEVDAPLEDDDAAPVDAAGLDVLVPTDLVEDVEGDAVDAAGLDAPSVAVPAAPEDDGADPSDLADPEQSSNEEWAPEPTAEPAVDDHAAPDEPAAALVPPPEVMSTLDVVAAEAPIADVSAPEERTAALELPATDLPARQQVADESAPEAALETVVDAQDDTARDGVLDTLPAHAVEVDETSVRPEAPAPVDAAVVTGPPAEDEPAPDVAATEVAWAEDDEDEDEDEDEPPPDVAAAAVAPAEDDEEDDLVYHPPPVHLSWRQADSLDFDVPSVDDPTNDILIEAPSQLVAPARRRNDPAARLEREEAARLQREQATRAEPMTVATGDAGAEDPWATRASLREAAREGSPRGRAATWVALAAVALVVVIAAVWFIVRDSGSGAAATPVRAATVSAFVVVDAQGHSPLDSPQG